MNRVAFILDNDSFQSLAEFFDIDVSNEITRELQVKNALGGFLANQCGLSHWNGFIQYHKYQRAGDGYQIGGKNHFFSPHLIHFLEKKDSTPDLPQGLEAWLTFCELIVLERSLFQHYYQKSDESFLLQKYVAEAEAKTVIIFGGTPALSEKNLALEHPSLIFCQKLQPGMKLPWQIKDALEQKGLPVLAEKRREASAYITCLDDQREELESLEAIFRNFYPKAFFHGLVYNKHIHIKEKIKELLDNWNRAEPFVVLLDVYLSDGNHGEHVLGLLMELRDEFPWLSFLVFSAAEIQEEVESYADQSRIKYLAKPTSSEAKSFKKCFDDLLDESRAATKAYLTVKKLEELEEKCAGQSALYAGLTYAKDGGMSKIVELIQEAAKTDSIVLITGESGTGKERVARALHDVSERVNELFFPINCVAFSEGLLESELFGHVKGGFANAIADKKGAFEIAGSGTLFLDEIGELSLTAQPKLLRVIQERELLRVGDLKTIKVNARLLAATNRDLLKMVKSGKFREDLYYRLNVLQINLPSLKEREEDVPVLIDMLLQGSGINLNPESKLLLMACNWPGNVRQLKNFIDRVKVIAEINAPVTVTQLVNIDQGNELGLDLELVEYLKTKEQKRQNPLRPISQDQNKIWEDFMSARITDINACFANRETVEKILEILSCEQSVNAALASNEDCQNLLNCICMFTERRGDQDWVMLRKLFKTPEKDEIKKCLPCDVNRAVKNFRKKLCSECSVLNKDWKDWKGELPQSQRKRKFLSHVFLGAAFTENWSKPSQNKRSKIIEIPS